MRAIDGDALIEHLTDWAVGASPMESDTGETRLLRQREYDTASQIASMIIAAPTIEGESWIGADKRPKKPGKYLVYGVTMFVPDHNGEPCGCWEIKTAYWSDKWGWGCKVKCWRPLPALPKEENDATD